MFQLDLKNRKSIYEQVVDNLKELIITGIINPKDKLPSVRDLSKQLTVNPNTIQKAYRSLEFQGYIYTVTGLGTFALRPAENKIDEAMVLLSLIHISEPTRLGMISYAVFCLKKK